MRCEPPIPVGSSDRGHTDRLYLTFRLAADHYALEVSRIAEVLPLVGIKQLPRSLQGIAGAFNYRGTPVPVIDLSELTLGRAAGENLSTRIILVLYPDGRGGTHLLGLIAEDATELIRRTPAEFMPSGVSNSAAPYLGSVAPASGGLVQLVEVERLLPAAVRDMLFAETQAT
jgi:chemotaxis-related protein WspB